jgi:hypothetical protein
VSVRLVDPKLVLNRRTGLDIIQFTGEKLRLAMTLMLVALWHVQRARASQCILEMSSGGVLAKSSFILVMSGLADLLEGDDVCSPMTAATRHDIRLLVIRCTNAPDRSVSTAYHVHPITPRPTTKHLDMVQLFSMVGYIRRSLARGRDAQCTYHQSP